MASQARMTTHARLLLTTALGAAALLPAAACAQSASQPSDAPAVLFSTGMQAGGATLRAGELLVGDAEIAGGITQLRTADGDIISIVGDSRITSSNGAVTLQRGRFTVVAGPDGVANVRVARDMQVTVNGQNASASFAVDPAGLLTGRSLGGTVSVTAGGVTRSFGVGEAFRTALDQAPTRTLAVGAQPVTAEPVSAAGALYSASPQTRFDMTQNPSLQLVGSGAPLDLLRQAFAAADRNGGFDFAAVSDAFKAASLASVGSGDALGYFNALTALVRAQTLIATAQEGSADAASRAYLAALLAYFDADGFAIGAAPEQIGAVTTYTQAVAAGIPTDAPTLVSVLSAYIGGLQVGTNSRNGGYTGDQLATMMRYLRGIGVPAGTDVASKARLDALFAFTDLGGSFGRTPGPQLPLAGSALTAGISSGLASGDYVGGLDTLEIGAPLARTYATGPVVFDANGAPTGFGDTSTREGFVRGALVGAEGASGPDWVIGRYAQTIRSTDGTYFALTKPYLSALPGAGTARYTVLAATTPTYIDGRVVTASSVDATLVLAFNSVRPLYGFEGAISATDLGATRTYSFSTPGGADAPSVSARFAAGQPLTFGDAIIVNAAMSDVMDPAVSGVCGSGSEGCLLYPNFVLGGTNGGIVAGTWIISKTGSFPQLGGALVLGGTLPAAPPPPPPPPPPLPPLPPLPPPPPPPPPTGTTAAIYSGGGFGDAGPITVTLDSAGAITMFGRTALGTVRLVDGQTGSGWILGRYADGTTLQTFSGTTTTQTYGLNNGVHYAYATAAPAALPTSGLATFGIAGFTTPTFADDSAATGATLTGGFAVAFGSTPKFGAAGILTLTNSGVQRYEYQTAGGLAAPSLSMFANGTTLFPSGSATVTTTDSRCAADCKVFFNMSTGGTASDVIAGTYTLGSSASGTFARLLNGAVAATTGTAVGAIPTPGVTPPPITPVTAADLTIASAYGATAVVQGGSTSVGAGQLRSIGTDAQGVARGFGDTPQIIFSGEARDVQAETTAGTEWRIGRLSSGTYGNAQFTTDFGAHDGLFYGLSARIPSFVPTSGTATYGLLAFTAPAYRTGGVVTQAALYGGITIGFASTPLFGIEGTLTVKEDGTARRYDFASLGGLASPAIALSNRNGVRALDAFVPVVSTDPRCAGGVCRFQTGLALGGTTGNLLSGVYGIGTVQGTGILAGAAVYKDGAPVTTAPLAGAVPGYTLLGYSNIAPGVQTEVTIQPNTTGGIDGYRTVTVQTGRGTATNTDSGSVSDIVGWTRWVSGTTQSSASQNARALDANNGGIIWAKPATNLPTTGTATYTFAGGTAPSFGSRLGTLDGGQMAVAFDTLKVGMEARVVDGADIYTVASSGGAAAPSMALDTATMRFSAGGSGASATGGACAAAVCSLRINGVLAGDGASHAAVAFTFGSGIALSANGVIAFTKAP